MKKEKKRKEQEENTDPVSIPVLLFARGTSHQTWNLLTHQTWNLLKLITGLKRPQNEDVMIS